MNGQVKRGRKQGLPRPVQQFVALVRETTGNVVPSARHHFLEELLERRSRSLGQPDLATYVHRLAMGELAAEWAQLIPLITIKESYFFRAPQQFRALTRTVLPRLMRVLASSRKLRIWSAACARGEEPATLAMVLAETGLLGSWDWTVLATDVDEDALASAERGIYGDRAVAQVPPDLLQKYFSPRGNRYRPLNLARLPFELPEDGYDLIFLRNVLIYFQRPLQRRVVSQVRQVLSKRGYLFLGASETLWQIHDELHSVDLVDCFSYRHSRPGERPPQQPPRPLRSAPRQPPRSVPRTSPGPVPKAAPEPPPGPPAGIEAPEPSGPELDAGPSLTPCALQQRLAEAARELADNELETARAILDEVLEADPSEPAAHALEGFLHDLENRPEDAVSCYRSALYLDPALFQARVLLGDCFLRLGHRNRAHQQFREVLAALDGGRGRELVVLDSLPLPNRRRAERRCRQVLRRG
jgi:chemotaxis protein methyltransferase CheR